MLKLSLSISLSFCSKYKDYLIGKIIPQKWINRLYVHLLVLDFFLSKTTCRVNITSKLKTMWLARYVIRLNKWLKKVAPRDK